MSTNENLRNIEEAIKENIPLVHYIINKYYKKFINDEDIVQVGTIGLWKALKYYDDSRGIAFASYASKCIINEIKMEFRYRYKELKLGSIISLDSPIRESNENLRMKDMIPDNYSESEFQKIEFYDIVDHTKFTKKEERIFSLLVENKKQCDIANILGVSNSYISHTTSNIKRKIIEQLNN